MKKFYYRRILMLLFIINLFAIGSAYIKYCKDQLPSNIHVRQGEETTLKYNVPAVAKVNKQTIQLNKSFVLKNAIKGKYEMEASLFGKIPLKTIKINVVKSEKIIPSGKIVGIYVETKGLLVLQTDTFTGVDGTNHSPSKKKLYEGDYIVAINGEKVTTKSDFVEKINKIGNKEITLSVRRNQKITSIKVRPVLSVTDHYYKIGAWIRDNTQGIGTLTYTKENAFGGLGHGICDMDTGKLMNVKGGYVLEPEINQIQKGKVGTPGEIIGSIYYQEKNVLGMVDKNNDTGIFGSLKTSSKGESYEIGYKQDVKIGKAYIISEISGKKEKYEIEIKKMNPTESDSLKGMEIEITDDRLLKLTNGIIQGMSGSPIIQNNRVIGAVTHVFVNDAKKGYGIFIEHMIKNIS